MLPRALSALVLLAALAAPAAAQERPLEDALSLANGDDCISAELLALAATDWLGRPTVDARIAVVVDVAAGGRAAAVIAIRDGAEVASRRFDPLPEVCADRRTVISLGVALAIDALLLETLASPHVEPIVASPAPAEVRASPAPIAIELAGEGGLAIDTLDGLAGLGAATIGLALPPLVRLRLGAIASSVASFGLGAGAVDASLALGRIDACLVARVDPLELDGCVGALAGGVVANGRGYASVRSAAQPWIGVAPRIEAALWMAEPIALTLAVDGLFSLVPPTFDVTAESGAILYAHTLPIASLAVSAGVRVRFR